MKNLIAALTIRFNDRISRPSRAAASAIGSIDRAQKMAADASSKWSRGLEELDGRLNRLASASLVTDGMARAGEAMMRPLRAGVAAAAEFNQGMTGIGITAQLTDSQLSPLRDTIMKTASDIGALPATVQATFGAVLAEGVYKTEAELSRAGIAVARFQRLQAVMGEPISDAEVGSFSAAMGTSLRLRADQLDRANAMVNRSAQQGGVSGAVLARNLPAQTGGLAGLNFANERGLADLLTANQLAKRLAGSSDQAANNITNLMSAIASPETMKRFEKAGINLEAQIKAGVARGVSPLETVANLTRNATSADQFRIGELFGDRQARDGLMALVQNFDEFRTMSRELQADDVMTGYLADLDRAAQGPAASFARYTTNIGRAGIATGSILAPAVGVAADALGRVAEWMSRAGENGSFLARAAVWAVAGFAGLAVGAGAVGHAVVGVLGPLYIMRTLLGPNGLGGAAFQGAGAKIIGLFGRMRLAAIGFNLSMLANPIVLGVVAAVAAVALIAVVVRKYWQPISAFFGGVGQALGEAFGPALSAIGSALAPLKPLWDGVTGAVSAFFGWVGRLMEPMQATKGQLDGASNAGRQFGRMLVLAFNLSPLGLFVNGIRQGIGVVRAVLAWRPMETLRAAWSGINTAGQLLMRGLAAAFSVSPLGALVRNVRVGIGVVRTVLTWRPMETLRAAWSGVGAFFGGLAGQFNGFGRAIIQGLIAGIRAMLGAVVGAVEGVASGAVGRFKAVLGIRSPSRVFAALGGYTMEGLAQGLDKGARRAVGVVTVTAGSMAAAMVGAEVPPPRRPPDEPPMAMAYSPSAMAAAFPGLFSAPTPPQAGSGSSSGGVHIQNLTIPVTVQGGSADARALGREIGQAAATSLRAALYDGVD